MNKEILINKLLVAIKALNTFYWEQEEPRANEISYEIGIVCEYGALLGDLINIEEGGRI